MRVLVAGASSGIGRAVVDALSREGDRCFGLSRRPLDPLPHECTWRKADLRSEEDCRSSVEAAARHLGGIDALVYAAGIGRLGKVEELGAADWGDLLATNLVGAALVTAAVLPYLRSSRGRAVYLSSHSVERPWPGLVAYAASKAGLDALVRGLREECPEVLFSLVVVGPTLSGFAGGWEPQRAESYFALWQNRGYLGEGVSDPSAVAEAVMSVLRCNSRLDTVRVMPPGPGG